MKGKGFLFALVLVYVALFVLDLLLIKNEVAIDSANVWNWGWIIASLQLVYFILSFKTVGPKELATVLFFGKPILSVDSGLVFVPFLICSLQKDTALVVQMQIPGEPEEIFRPGDGESEKVPEGMVLPIRILTAPPEVAKDKHPTDYPLVVGNPLNEQMTLEVSAIARMRINDYAVFIKTIGDMDKARKQVRDMFETVLNSEFVTRTPALIRLHWEAINQEVQKVINDLAKSWGMVMEPGTQMVSIDPTHTVNKSLRDRLNARIVAATVITAAEAEKTKRDLEGQGTAAAELSLLEAQAKGKTALAEVAKTKAGRYAMSLETVSKTVENAQYSIVGTDGIGGTIAAGIEVLNKVNSTKKKPAAEKPADENGKGV